jgi:RNA recognition motif-containing protein
MKDKVVSKDLYVSDISFEVCEEDLQKLFALCGTVHSIHLLTDPKSGLFRGCAFVRMATIAEAKDAIVTLDGARLLNRCISVRAARPKIPAAQAVPAPSAKPAKPARRPRPRRQRK